MQNTLQTCRTQHQTWAATLSQSEQDIDQLIQLLAELPGESYRSFSHHASDYTRTLNRLKGQIQMLRRDVVCSGTGCAGPVMLVACSDQRFVSPPISNSLMLAMSAEYDRLKDRCQLFLSELMRLNLI